MHPDEIKEQAESEHDKLCVDGVGCETRQRHIERSYIPRILREKLVEAQRRLSGWVSPAEVARRETVAKAEAWQEGYEMGMYDTPPDPTNNPYCSTTEGAGE